MSSISASSVPEPLKAVAGLAVVAIDEAKSLPQKLAGLPVAAAGSAMQASMRVQQQYAELVGRGEDLLNALNGAPDDTPEWATFDEDVPLSPPVTVTAPKSNGVGPGSAFDRHVDDAPIQPARRRTGPRKSAPAAASFPADPDAPVNPDPAPLAKKSAPVKKAAPAAAKKAVKKAVPAAAKKAAPAKKSQPAKKLAPPPKVAPAKKSAVAVAPDAPIAGYADLTLPQLRARVRNYSASQLEELIRYETDGLDRAPYTSILATRLATLRRT